KPPHHYICKRRTTFLLNSTFARSKHSTRNLLSISRAEWPWESSGINRRAAFTRDLSEAGNHPQADRPRFSRPDHPPIRLDHRNYFRRGAAEKAFVGDENIVPADIGLGNLYSKFRRDFKYDRARDSAQRARRYWRRKNFTAFDHENIVSRAFRDAALVV